MLQHWSKETRDQGDRRWLTARHHFVVSPEGNPANDALGASRSGTMMRSGPAPASTVTPIWTWKS
jgi:hypothetical protein